MSITGMLLFVLKNSINSLMFTNFQPITMLLTSLSGSTSPLAILAVIHSQCRKTKHTPICKNIFSNRKTRTHAAEHISARHVCRSGEIGLRTPVLQHGVGGFLLHFRSFETKIACWEAAGLCSLPKVVNFLPRSHFFVPLSHVWFPFWRVSSMCFG